jgi:ATP-dependent protease Clp ATPase subunit
MEYHNGKSILFECLNENVLKPVIYMDYSHEEIKKALVGGAALLGAMAIRKLMEKSWVNITKEDPPKNPKDKEVSWKKAIVWAVCTGAIVGLTKLIMRRNAHVGAEKWLKI